MPLTGIDDAWQTRIPQGWQQFADGTIGPPNQVGSDWNAPYRGAPAGPAGLPDWLKQLIPSPGASVPNAPGGPGGGVGPGGAYMPGGGVMGRRAVTPGAPSMGFPAQGGQIDPAQLAGAGGGNPLSMFGNINPYARAAIAAGGVMQPTPAQGPGAPTNSWMQRPSGVGGMPGPQATNPTPQPGADGINPYAAAAAANPPQGGPYVGSGAPAPFRPPSRPYSPTPQSGPMDPSIIAHLAMTTPPGNPSDTPRPGATPYPPKRPKNLGATAAAPSSPSSNPRFSTFQYQVPGSGGPLSRSPIYTALNLFGGKS